MRWDEIRDHNLDAFVTDVFHKPTTDYVAGLEEMGVPLIPDFVVDDYPGIVAAFGGFFVSEYYKPREDDQLFEVYQTICDHAQHGTSSHPRYRPNPRALGA